VWDLSRSCELLVSALQGYGMAVDLRRLRL